jgi:hypothetical protein
MNSLKEETDFQRFYQIANRYGMHAQEDPTQEGEIKL